jgi:hypothetical protein
MESSKNHSLQQKKKFQNNRLANIANWENETPNLAKIDATD